jgi:2-dehydro-3-deoxyphosphogluconate aldolase/(4S)-4-hydroxy-2-oxoglutarate aldolase
VHAGLGRANRQVMTREQVRRRIIEVGIVPVVRAESKEQAIAAANAVRAGGIPIVEITMTVPDAIEAIRTLSETMPEDVLIGAGTVLDARTARECFEAGAQFLVSPIFNAEMIQFAQEMGKLTMAGAMTPNEVVMAWQSGTDFVKIFPCGNVGGASYIKALKAALPQIPMIPTGGVNLDTAAAFLAAGASALGVGGELISAAALKAGDIAAIAELARKFVRVVQAARHTR